MEKELQNFKKQNSYDLQQVANQKGGWVKEKKKGLVKKMGKIEEKLQNRLFRTDKSDDAKYDLLKLLYIGDSELKNPQNCLFVSNIETLASDNQGNLAPYKFLIFQELCKKGEEFTCQGFRPEDNDLILSKLGFSEAQKWVVKDVSHLLKCCYEFSNRLIEEEKSYFDPEQCPKIARRLEEIKSQNEEDSPVIRIGKNEGYLSLTMGLLVKDRDETLYNNVLIHATKNTSYTGNFPKTRRIVSLGENKFDTLGWVKLILES